MITGIGGLGKTTLAYRFAEDVTDTGAGEMEQLIWLTARAADVLVAAGQDGGDGNGGLQGPGGAFTRRS